MHMFVCFLNKELLKPEEQTLRSEDTCSKSVKLDDDIIVETTTQWCKQHRNDDDVEVGYISLQPLFWGEHRHYILKMQNFICFLVSPLKADACQNNITELNRGEPDVSEKPDVDITKSYKDFPVLSFAVTWESENGNIIFTSCG